MRDKPESPFCPRLFFSLVCRPPWLAMDFKTALPSTIKTPKVIRGGKKAAPGKFPAVLYHGPQDASLGVFDVGGGGNRQEKPYGRQLGLGLLG